jgi:hypothetical protein
MLVVVSEGCFFLCSDKKWNYKKGNCYIWIQPYTYSTCAKQLLFNNDIIIFKQNNEIVRLVSFAAFILLSLCCTKYWLDFLFSVEAKNTSCFMWHCLIMHLSFSSRYLLSMLYFLILNVFVFPVPFHALSCVVMRCLVVTWILWHHSGKAVSDREKMLISGKNYGTLLAEQKKIDVEIESEVE